MFILRIILGILMIISAASVLALPEITAIMLVNCFIPAFMLVFGIFSIVRFIEAKNAEKVLKENGLPYLKTGIGSLIFGIAAVVLFILSRRSETASLVLTKAITVIFGLWIMFSGISFIVKGVALKKLAANGWLALIILGVLIVIAGIFFIVNTFASLTGIGTMFGISMMMTGFAMMFSFDF